MVKIELSYDPANALLDTYQEKYSHKNLCMNVYRKVFILAKTDQMAIN